MSVTLSDRFCVDRHRDAFLDLVEHHVDLVFANEAEITALYQVDDFDAAVEAVAVTARSPPSRDRQGLGDRGPDEIRGAAHPVDELVDTTGAGDLYAAGFLFGSPQTCRWRPAAAWGRWPRPR